MVRLSPDDWLLAADAEARLLGVALIERMRWKTGGGAMMTPSRMKRHLFLKPGNWNEDTDKPERGPNSICNYAGWCHTRELFLLGDGTPGGHEAFLSDQDIPHCKLCRKDFHRAVHGYSKAMLQFFDSSMRALSATTPGGSSIKFLSTYRCKLTI